MKSGSREKKQNEEAAANRPAAVDPDIPGLRATIVMRGHLLANVAHEIRTPLSAIRGYARMLTDGRAGEVNERQTEYLSAITENTDKLIHLVNWMTRIGDPSQQIMRLSPVDGRVLWTECLSARKGELFAKSIHIDEAFSDESFPILGDRSRLDRLFALVLDTAIRYSSSGSRLSMTMSCPREGGLGVKVSGIGGAMADAADASSPAGSSEAAGESEALTLASIYDIVGLHGGRLFIRRTSEEGSVILFTLPDVRRDDADEWSGQRPA